MNKINFFIISYTNIYVINIPAIYTRSNKQSSNAEKFIVLMMKYQSRFRQIFQQCFLHLALVLSKTKTKTQIPSTDMTNIQHQIDALRQEIEKNTPENNEFKNLIKKKLTKERIHKRDETEILYEKITILGEENQCLKNKVKNQQAVIEMLIIGDNCGNERNIQYLVKLNHQ